MQKVSVANIEEHSTYLSKEELNMFVASTAKEIITQISVKEKERKFLI